MHNIIIKIKKPALIIFFKIKMFVVVKDSVVSGPFLVSRTGDAG